MAFVTLQFDAYYRCRQRGRFLPTTIQTIIMDTEESPTGDYSDVMLAEAERVKPENCDSYSVDHTPIVTYAPGDDDTGEPTGADVSVRAYIWFLCVDEEGDEETRPIEYLQNFPAGTTLGEVLDSIRDFGSDISDDIANDPGYFDGTFTECAPLSIQILEPTYWAMSTGI